MNTRVLLILIGTVVAALVLAWLLLGNSEPEVVIDEAAFSVDIDPTPTPTPAPESSVILLFAGSDGLLHPELRGVALPADVYERATLVVRELLAGPRGKLRAVVPYDATLNALYLDNEGRAFVDLTAPPQGLEGSHIELMLAYGVVNSVLLNCPELTAVQLLFGGSEVPTLTGHLDLSRPLVLNKRLIAAS
jgi:hypothetical protein